MAIHWSRDFRRAQEESRADNRPLVVDFTAAPM
jgi:hypothetical protein